MTAKPPLSTHHWQWTLEVENDFRNSRGRLEHRWYSALALFSEASWVAGPLPSRVLPEHRIRVLFRGQEVGSHRDKESAVGQVRKLLEEAPPSCREYATVESWALLDTIFGPGGWKHQTPGTE